MRQAVQDMDTDSLPEPADSPDPDGPVRPLDLPDLSEIPVEIGDAQLRIRPDEGLTISADIGGVPIDLSVDDGGFSMEPRNRRSRDNDRRRED